MEGCDGRVLYCIECASKTKPDGSLLHNHASIWIHRTCY